MEVFKKPWVAVLVSIALVLASTLISAGTKLDRKVAEVTDGFYEGVTYDGYKHPSIYSQLSNLCGAADGIAAIAANNGIDCDELTKASNGLKASISTMHDNISAIYESYSTLSGALSEFLTFTSEAATRLNLARTVARRAERCAVSAACEIRPEILCVLNRSSDAIFALARAAEKGAL